MTPTGTEARVCEDIRARQEKGLRKYGIHVHENPLPLRMWAQHCYEELLDSAVYLRRMMDEMDGATKDRCYYCSSSDHADNPCPKRKKDADEFAAAGREIYPTTKP